MDAFTQLTDRAVLAVSGEEARSFLQGLITNDVRKLTPEAPLYAALLTPQGKILFDFLLYEAETAILVDCAGERAAALEKRLSLYKLRAKVAVARRDDLAVVAVLENESTSRGSWSDPRLAALGQRSIVRRDGSEPSPSPDYTARRLDLGVPEGTDFGQDAMFALDADLEELHGVAFDKGCYVGQELTARMKHRGTARKKLLSVETGASALPAPGAAVTAEARDIGVLTSVYGQRGFALIRTDRLEEARGMALKAADTPVRVRRPEWLFP